MIRQETIFSKLFLIKISDLKLLDAMQPRYDACPSCGAAGRCSPHGPYLRCMISICDGARKEHEISVPRVICGSCGSTHALLADVLIPYSSYSLRFILHVLRAYFYRNCTVEALCERFSIAISTLYEWMHLFKTHANLWLSALQQILLATAEALDCFEDIQMLPSSFFRRYGFSFLQSRRATRCSRSP